MIRKELGLVQLSRYIHLNPVQTKMVAKPTEYSWSSYPVFVGNIKKPDWLTTGEVLGHFSKRKKTAIKHYRSFVEELDVAVSKDLHKEIFGGFILGNTSFIKWVQNTFLASQKNAEEIPQLRRLKPKVSPAEILEAVCIEYKCEKEQIITKGRHHSQERGMGIYLARDLSGVTGKELGTIFGVSGAAITLRYNQFSKEIIENKKLRKRVQKIKKQILNF